MSGHSGYKNTNKTRNKTLTRKNYPYMSLIHTFQKAYLGTKVVNLLMQQT